MNFLRSQSQVPPEKHEFDSEKSNLIARSTLSGTRRRSVTTDSPQQTEFLIKAKNKRDDPELDKGVELMAGKYASMGARCLVGVYRRERSFFGYA